MASNAGNDDDGIVGINVTPLVDITLVLLVIFMVTARLIASRAVPMDLPSAATAGETQVVLTISIETSGAISIDGARVDEAELHRRARGVLAASREPRAVIHASRSTTHGSVIHVVDELRRAGITRIAFAAEKTS
jgi:biopolymer transport protein ExbD